MEQFLLVELYNFPVLRYPIVERAVADVRMFSDQSFMSGIRTSVQKILREDRAKAPTQKGVHLPIVHTVGLSLCQ